VGEFSLADGNEVINNLTRSKLQSRLGVNEKLAMLQRAEENFYKNNNSYKQVCLYWITSTLLVKKVHASTFGW